MALTCPKCEKLNLCSCKSCNPNSDMHGVAIPLKDEDLYQCFWCSEKFHECESLDFEWDRMHEDFKKSITPEMAFHWISLKSKERKEYQDNYSYGEYGFQSAFFQHFGIRYSDCGQEQIKKIKLQIERDKKLNQLL